MLLENGQNFVLMQSFEVEIFIFFGLTFSIQSTGSQQPRSQS